MRPARGQCEQRRFPADGLIKLGGAESMLRLSAQVVSFLSLIASVSVLGLLEM